MAASYARSILFVMVFSALALPTSAQSTATLQGNVTDQQGAVIPGATIVIRNQATGVDRSLVTDAAGEYQAASLAPGRYRIEVIDLLENPKLARDDQILAIPTLVRKLPEPLRKIVGDLSNTERMLVGFDLRPVSP